MQQEQQTVKDIKSTLKTIYTAVFSLAMVSALVISTYAWMTSNSKVSTSTASGRTDTEEVTFQMSRDGATWSTTELTLTPMTDILMPASTDKTFTFWGTGTSGESMQLYRKDDLSGVYKDTFYIRAQANGNTVTGNRLRLYFDTAAAAGSDLVTSTDTTTDILSAGRLGLRITPTDNSATATNWIFSLRENNTKSVGNTYIDGKLVQGNVVIASDGTAEGYKAVEDPAVYINKYCFDSSASSSTPEGILLTMEMNKTYTVEVYYYLEGCDPDCQDEVQGKGIEMHLAFYGVMTTQTAASQGTT